MADPGDADQSRLRLVVSFLDDELSVDAGDSLTFGRQADLVIDENPHLHRRVGRFSYRDGFWWLQNLGSSIELVARTAAGESTIRLRPGAQAPLSYPEVTLSFGAGVCRYELGLRLEAPLPVPPLDPAETDAGSETVPFADIPLTDSQRALIVALAETRLRTPQETGELPSNRDAAGRLGWSLTKFNRKLDNVCDKLARQGVPNLRGTRDRLATDRRRRMLDHALQAGLVTSEDLDLLA